MFSPFFVESSVTLTLAIHRMVFGFVVAFPAPLFAGLTGNNTDIHTTKEEASWIAASFNITGAISYFILPSVMEAYGRRISNIVHNVILMCGAVVIALAPNVPSLIAGQCIQGFGYCGLFLNVVIAAEYCHPRRRGFSLTLQSTATCVGIILCHSVGFILTWRQTAWIGVVISAIGATCTITWPESPSWLAYRGRYEDCIEAFKILREDNSESRRELRHLIAAQREIKKLKQLEDSVFVRTLKTVTCKEFLMPLAILMVIDILVHVCGIYYFLAYITRIMQQLSGDESKIVYYTIGFDSMKVVALVISSAMLRVVKIRTLLFCSSSLALFLLSLVCAFDYLQSIGAMDVKWLTSTILIVYNFVCYVGMIPVYLVLIGELFPLQYKSVGASAVGLIYCLSGFIIMKYTSTMLDVLHIYGTFAVYLVIAVVCLITLYFILPETRHRTLQEIEMDFTDIKFEFDNDIELDQEVITKLVK